MPALLQASISSVPGDVVIVWPSTVIDTLPIVSSPLAITSTPPDTEIRATDRIKQPEWIGAVSATLAIRRSTSYETDAFSRQARRLARAVVRSQFVRSDSPDFLRIRLSQNRLPDP